MKNYLITAAVTTFIFLAIDFVWLAVISKNLYSTALGHLMTDKIKLLPALAFYVLFALALAYIAVMPGVQEKSLSRALVYAAILGFVSYATYDLTNFATLRDWPLKIVFIDIAWGTSLSTVTALASFFVSKLMI